MQIKQVNGIYRTECLSFPRSGQAALRGALKKYFGDRLNWSEPYKHPETSLDRNPETNFMKNHDHNLTVTIRDDRKYIVLIRDPIEAIQSWHKMKEGGVNPVKWNEFWKDKIRYYAGFTNKWIIDPVPNRVIVRYERLLEEPPHVFEEIVSHITDKPISGRRILDATAHIQRKTVWDSTFDRRIQTL